MSVQRDLFLRYVPSSVGADVAAYGLALVSTQLWADHRNALTGTVPELTFPGNTILRGILMGAKQEDVGLVVSTRSGDATDPIEDIAAIIAVARSARFDRPLSIQLQLGELLPLDDAAEANAYRWLQAGYTGVSCRLGETALTPNEIVNSLRPYTENGIGIDLHVDSHETLGNFIRSNIPLASSGPYHDDRTTIPRTVEEGLRDDRLSRTHMDNVIQQTLGHVIETGDSSTTDLLEARAFAMSAQWFRKSGARGVASQMLDALIVDTGLDVA